jgi:hypothetical protein
MIHVPHLWTPPPLVPEAPGKETDVKRCCRRPENLRRARINGSYAVDVCTVCTCRHYHLHIDLGRVFGG